MDRRTALGVIAASVLTGCRGCNPSADLAKSDNSKGKGKSEPPPIEPPTEPPPVTVTAPALPTPVADLRYKLPVGGTLRVVGPTDDLQAAIDEAVPGDVISVDSTGTYTGAYTIGPKTGTGWIYIISSTSLEGEEALPQGVRVTPAEASLMPTIKAVTWQHQAFTIQPGAARWRFVGLNITTVHDNRLNAQYGIIRLGNQNVPRSPPYADRIIFDRCWIHGHPNANVQMGVFVFEATNWAVMNCWIDELSTNTNESYAIDVIWALGPGLIYNNYLEASTENIMLNNEGGDYPLVIAHDVTITRNTLCKNLVWYNKLTWGYISGITQANPAVVTSAAHGLTNGRVITIHDVAGMTEINEQSAAVNVLTANTFELTGINSTSYTAYSSPANSAWWGYPSNPAWGGVVVNVKNLLELKNCRRVLIEGNDLHTCWTQGQQGEAFVITCRNAPIEDLTIRYNYAHDTERWFNLAGPESTVARVSIHDNLWKNMGDSLIPVIYPVKTSEAFGFDDLSICHNTTISLNPGSWLVFESGSAEKYDRIDVKDNLATHGNYGITGSGYGPGIGAVDYYCINYLFRNNAFIGSGISGLYVEQPNFGGWLFPADNAAVGFADTAFTDPMHFKLVSTSPYIASSTDGKPAGADIDTLWLKVLGPIPPELPDPVADMPFSLPTGTVHNVTSGGDLQAALNAAQYGHVVVIEAGATFTGTFSIPAGKTGTGWLYVISSALASLPEGVRVTPASAAFMPTLKSAFWYQPTLILERGCDRVRFAGLEVTISGSVNASELSYAPFRVATYDWGTGNCDRIVVERCYVHGEPTYQIYEGIMLTYVTNGVVKDCWVDEIHHSGAESHAIFINENPGPVLVENNYFSASGMSMFTGENQINHNNYDHTYRRNHLEKLVRWVPHPNPPTVMNPDYQGFEWGEKNMFEIKGCCRCLVEGNEMHVSWYDNQPGGCMLFNAWGAPIQDLTVRGNYVYDFTAGVQFAPGQFTPPTGRLNPVNRVLFEDNLFHNFKDLHYYSPFFFQFTSSWTGKLTDIHINHNTILVRSDGLGFHRNIIFFDGDHTVQDHVMHFLYQNMIQSCGTEGMLFNNYGSIFAGFDWYCGKYNMRDVHWTDYPYDTFWPQNANFAKFTYSPNKAAVGFSNPSYSEIEHFRLQEASPYAHAASDGGPLGARIDNVLSAMGESSTKKVMVRL